MQKMHLSEIIKHENISGSTTQSELPAVEGFRSLFAVEMATSTFPDMHKKSIICKKRSKIHELNLPLSVLILQDI